MKKIDGNSIFHFLCVSLAFMILMGCSDTAIQDTLLSPSVNGYSVVRGVITDNSIRLESRSKLSQSVTTSTGSSSSIGVDMALMTDLGIVLQRRSFQQRNQEGNFEF
ncbi:hypothetical protein MJH12_07910, partial [bacterium]|nr:hypothetical protein [bacterium]